MASSMLRSLVLAPVVLLSLAACGSIGGSDDGPVTVTFVAGAWSEGGAGDEVTTTVEATKGESVTVDGPHGGVEVTFTSVSSDSVDLETGDEMAPEGKTGGINLNDTRTDFTVESGRELKFSTPTTDSGTTWVVTIGDPATPSS